MMKTAAVQIKVKTDEKDSGKDIGKALLTKDLSEKMDQTFQWGKKEDN